MINIYEQIHSALARLGSPVHMQGSFAPGEKLPDTFLTYQIIDSPSSSHADNRPTSITYRIQVALYSKRPTMVQSAESSIRTTMLASGFMRGSGRDLPFDPGTGHYGYTCDYKFYDSEV